MEPYKITGTEDTPEIILDKQNNIYSISGRSLPEDVVTFYRPTLEWLTAMGENPVSEMTLDIRLEYFNTASSKLLLDILMKLDDIAGEKNIKVAVNWHYDKNDEDMEEAGEEYSELVSIPFNMKTL